MFMGCRVLQTGTQPQLQSRRLPARLQSMHRPEALTLPSWPSQNLSGVHILHGALAVYHLFFADMKDHLMHAA